MALTYIGKDGTIRWYDSTATRPWYFEAVYEQMDFSGPLGRPRAEDIAVLDRGLHTTNTHYVEAVDDAIMEPVDISFSCRLDDTNLRVKLRDVLKIDTGAWTVGGNTWLTTKGDTSLVPGDGTAAVVTPAFADAEKFCTNLEVLWDVATNDIGIKYGEVYWPPDQQTLNEAEDSLMVNLTGRCYGTITEITEFSTGAVS